MKRLISVFVAVVFVVGLFSGCDLNQPKEGQIVFSLEEIQESDCAWVYFIDPEGAIEKVRDEILEEDGTLFHKWIFEGVEEGEVGITFQYSEEGEDPIRTVSYTCFVDENLYVDLIEVEDSAEEAGTVADERLIQCVSSAISLQFSAGMTYPTGSVSKEYAEEFLNCYANLFFGEIATEEGIVLEEEAVEEILHIAFGNRIGADDLALESHDRCYYFIVKDYLWVDAIPMEEELQYVFTAMGDAESIDGTATVTVSETSKNSAGLTLKSVTAQKSE